VGAALSAARASSHASRALPAPPEETRRSLARSRSRWAFITRYMTADKSVPHREQSLVPQKGAPQTGQPSALSSLHDQGQRKGLT
ncbi:MAG: hypothetical protein ACRD1Z_07480, partial [Vicinamibacteria bacterium]